MKLYEHTAGLGTQTESIGFINKKSMSGLGKVKGQDPDRQLYKNHSN